MTCSLRKCKARQGNNTYRLYLRLRWRVTYYHMLWHTITYYDILGYGMFCENYWSSLSISILLRTGTDVLTDVSLSSWTVLTSKQSWQSDAGRPRGGELRSNGSSPLVGSYFKDSLLPGNHPAELTGEQWLSQAPPVLCAALQLPPPSLQDWCL